jgi:DNA-binding transcriptional MerR regulator
VLEKSSSAFRTISEVAAELDVPKHVLRFWEGKFPQLRPMKRGGGRRYYRPEDIELLRGIRWLLYSDGYTIKGVQRILRDNGVKFVKHCWRDQSPAADTERTFEIPNLAGEAAKAARQPLRAPERVAPIASTPSRSKEEAPVRPIQQPAHGDEQREFLLSLMSELEACKDLLQSAVEQEAAAKPKGRAAKRPASGR